MKVPLVDLNGQYKTISAAIDSSIKRVIASSDFILGKETERFEKSFARYIGASQCVGVNSGTDALLIGLKALGLSTGAEVIVPVNTFNATAEAVILAGLTPVFIDCDEEFGMDLKDLKRKITRRTRAIIVVHLFGRPEKLDEMKRLLNKRIFLIEDCAQAHGAVYKKKRVGSFGIFSAFSFYPSKNLGAYGDAGAILTSNSPLAKRTRALRNHGSQTKDEHERIAYNSRLDGLQAAILGVKLPHLAEWNKKRQQAAKDYSKQLSAISSVITPHQSNEQKSVFYVYVIRAKQRDSLRTFLAKKNIQTGVHYPTPLHLQKAFQNLGYKRGDFPIAEKVSKELLSLPIYPEITAAQIRYTSTSIKKFYEKS